MMNLIRPMVAACLMCGMLGAAPAAAEGGRITFSGAVVAPTCAAPAEATVLMDSDLSSSRTVTCAGRSRVAAGSGDVSSYELSVTRLDANETAGSPLLQYFAGYLAASHAGDARMVTRTYR